MRIKGFTDLVDLQRITRHYLYCCKITVGRSSTECEIHEQTMYTRNDTYYHKIKLYSNFKGDDFDGILFLYIYSHDLFQHVMVHLLQEQKEGRKRNCSKAGQVSFCNLILIWGAIQDLIIVRERQKKRISV